MITQQRLERSSGHTFAISDTGPLISAFQSDSIDLVAQIFPIIFVPEECKIELAKHGWKNEVSKYSSVLEIAPLTALEKEQASDIASRIVHDSNDPVIESHLGEAQAIVVASRPEHHDDVLLIDERVARTIAK